MIRARANAAHLRLWASGLGLRASGFGRDSRRALGERGLRDCTGLEDWLRPAARRTRAGPKGPASIAPRRPNLRDADEVQVVPLRPSRRALDQIRSDGNCAP